MHGFLTEDFCIFMVMGWDDLVPGANGFIGGLFRKLLHYSGLCSASGIDIHDVEVQFLSGFEEGLVSDCGSHSCDPYGAHWFPRCYSFGADDDRGRERASHPIGVSIRRCKPRISKDEVVRSHVSDVETEEVRSFSGDNFEFGVVFQTPSCIRGSISVLEFPGVFHKIYP